jgi:hypothetical protein
MYEILIRLSKPREISYMIVNLHQCDMVGFSGHFRCRCCCEDEIGLLKEICHKDSSYERSGSAKTGFYFAIVDKERGVLFTSLSFNDQNETEDQIAAMKQYLPNAEVCLLEPL